LAWFDGARPVHHFFAIARFDGLTPGGTDEMLDVQDSPR
jgi:hypothetical protein